LKPLRIAILLIFFFLFSCQDINKDSVNRIHSDSLSVYIAKSEDLKSDVENRMFFITKAVSILNAQKRNDSILRKNLFKVAGQYYSFNDYIGFERTTKYALQKAIEAKDTIHIVRAYLYLAKKQTDFNINDSAFYLYTRAEKLSLSLNDSESLANIYVNKAFIQLYENDYSGCELSSSKALNVLKNSPDKKKIYDAYNLIGICSNEMKSYDRALDYHNRALKIISENNLSGNYHLSSNSLNNIGVVYQNMNRHSDAIRYFKEALSEKNLFRDSPGLYSILLDNLAYSKFKYRDFNNIPSLFYESLKIRDSLKLDSGIVINKIHLSEFYAYRKDTAASQKFANEALNLSRTTKISGDILLSLKQVSQVEHINAAAYSKEYIRISDSIQQAERKIKDRFDRIQFETDEITQENDKLAEQNRNLLYFFIGTLMIGMLLFVIRTQRAKNRELLLKQAQQKANEDIYNLMISQQNKIEESRIREKKRIAQELHDGVLGRLFGARLNLDSLNRQNNDEAATKRNDYLSELKNIEQDIREISHDLNREKYVLINNFIAILNNLLEEQRSSFAPEVIVAIDDSIKWELLENTSKINLYRIIQESLQNINKYAKASTIKLEIKLSGENLVLNISDNGEGFAVNTKKKGIGLQNMVSRAHELNGTFDVRSKKGKGTTITVSFPSENKYTQTV
jgi:signal transduction histidine kinase/Tfp pilus assembly protein PilF